MKKIAFVGPIPPPLGGVAVVNVSFQKLNYANAQVLFFNTSNNQDRENLYTKFSIKNSYREIKKTQSLKKFIVINKPDLVHIFITSGYAILRDLIFLKIISNQNIPVVIHFHSKTTGEFALKPKRLTIIGRLFDKYAATIVLLSNEHLLFFNNYFPKHKCIVIENFVDYAAFDCEIIKKNNSFLFVGRLTKQKGFYDLLHAIKIVKQQINNLKVHVIGLADTAENELTINTFIAANNLSENIILHGAKYESEKNELFKSCFCLLFPSHFENSPVVLKEAIAAKMAIIASDIQANKNILQLSKNHLFFEKANSNHFALQIIALCNNQSLALSMMQASAQIIAYDSAFATKKMNQITEELC